MLNMDYLCIHVRYLFWGIFLRSAFAWGCFGSQSCGNSTTVSPNYDDDNEDTSSHVGFKVGILSALVFILILSFCICFTRHVCRQRQPQPTNNQASHLMMMAVVSDILSQSIRDRETRHELQQSNASYINDVTIDLPSYDDVLNESAYSGKPPSYQDAVRESFKYSHREYRNVNDL